MIVATSTVGHVATVFGVIWFLLNVYVWLVPKMRRRLIEQRGPLLGVGYAIAAAIVSAVIDGFSAGISKGLVLFGVRFLLLLLPFLLPFRLRLPRAPHPSDALVLAYALLLPYVEQLVGTFHPWIELSSTGSGFFAAMGSGHMIAAGLITTYFFGVRWWSEIVIDWKVRPGDMRQVLYITLAACVGALLFGENAATQSLSQVQGVILLLLVAPFEEVVFRGIGLAGLKRQFLTGRKGSAHWFVAVTLPLIVALVHAAIGFHRPTSFAAAFGFSLGIGLVQIHGRRLMPAVLGHMIAVVLLSMITRFVF